MTAVMSVPLRKRALGGFVRSTMTAMISLPAARPTTESARHWATAAACPSQKDWNHGTWPPETTSTSSASGRRTSSPPGSSPHSSPFLSLSDARLRKRVRLNIKRNINRKRALSCSFFYTFLRRHTVFHNVRPQHCNTFRPS